MKNIKPIVQVMNLYSLVRINSAKARAEEFGLTSEVLTKIISSIIYNKNIVFDKHSIEPDSDKPVLNIYIASDHGFCSTYNHVVLTKVREDKDAHKIIIGNKVSYNDDLTVMRIEKDSFPKELPKIKEFLSKALLNHDYREIKIYYNHYNNFSSTEFKELRVFPVEYKEEYQENVDFLVETDISSFIDNLISYYVCYQLEICEVSSYASENVIRYTLTLNSINKLEEKEEEEKMQLMKETREKNLKKNIENSKKILYVADEDI